MDYYELYKKYKAKYRKVKNAKYPKYEQTINEMTKKISGGKSTKKCHKEIFSKIWNTNDLIVSFDGISIYILNKPTRIQKSWFHVDQSYTRNNFECVQSWINAYDTNEKDATLVILENSHNFHKKFQEFFNIIDKKDWFKLNQEHYNFYINIIILLVGVQNCLLKNNLCVLIY